MTSTGISFIDPVFFKNPENSLQVAHNYLESYCDIGLGNCYQSDGSLLRSGYAASLKQEKNLNPITDLFIKTLKAFSYTFYMFSLPLLLCRTLSRLACRFQKIPDTLEEAQFLRASTIKKVQRLVPAILKGEEIEGLEYLGGQAQHKIFAFNKDSKIDSEFVFKIDRDNQEAMHSRYYKMLLAANACHRLGLDLLCVPNAFCFTAAAEGKSYTVLAERRFNISKDEGLEEQKYLQHASKLQEHVRQLSIFICHTDFSDMTWRNAPIFEDKDGKLKIALIDLEELSSLRDGLVGARYRRGLIGCLNEDLGRVAAEEIRQQNVEIEEKDLVNALEMRKKELEDDRKLAAFHQGLKITSGSEEIILRDDLDFPGYSDSDVERLKQTAKDFIQEINRKIKESSCQTVKDKRSILIASNSPFYLNALKLADSSKTYSDYQTDKAYHAATLLGVVVNELIQKGYLYALRKRDGYGYWIQA